MNLNIIRNIGFNELSKAWLRDIDNSIDQALDKNSRKTTQDSLDDISNILTKMMPGYKFEFKLIKPSKPFMMCIYPDLKQLESRCYNMTTILNDIKQPSIDFIKEWNSITKWTIEVDENLFNPNSKYKVSNGREFTAILLHEIGHATSNSHFRLINNYRMNRAKFQMVEKLLLSESYLLKKVFLPMYIHTLNFRVITSGHITHNLDEIKADLSIPTEYKADLVSYLDRCILSDPNTMNALVCTKSEFDEDQKVSILFTRETLQLMKNRRNILNRYVSAQYKTTESPYIKEFTKRFAKLFSGFKVDENKVDIVSEGMIVNQFIMECSKYEDIALRILQESQRISDRDLVILQVEGDSIETNEDKIYILHNIYDYIENITSELKKKNKLITLEEINKDPRIVYLLSLKKQVMDKKIIDKEYGVFIKYPKGYEG